MKKDKEIAVVGAGFSGAVIANLLAAKGYRISVFDKRSHIGGNCHTTTDSESNIMMHFYGPHIFHTDYEDVWAYINKFGKFFNYINRVKAITNDRVFSLPINLMTINQFFNKKLSPKEAKIFIDSIVDKSINNPVSFEDQALRFVGKDIYEAFFKEYTKKQWGVEPDKLPASILKRLPLRFNYDDNYFNHKYQGVPIDGYTEIIRRMLDSKNICIYLCSEIGPQNIKNYDHVFYSGKLDEWFNYDYGHLPYRTLDFELIRDIGDYQGTAVINYCDSSVPYTRITEHKHLSPWLIHERTVCYKEYSRSCEKNDIPYYPIHLSHDNAMVDKYVKLSKLDKKTTFIGRLGTFRYLNMDETIKESFNVVYHYLNHLC